MLGKLASGWVFVRLIGREHGKWMGELLCVHKGRGVGSCVYKWLVRASSTSIGEH